MVQFKLRIALVASALAALLFAFAISGEASGASADSDSATYQYLIGTGFICSLGPGVCPDVAMAPNGDTITITGEGRLSVHPKSANGGGAFTHRDSHGNVKGTGTWTAEELLSFKSFGAGPGFPAGFTGGHALISIHLLPAAGGPGFDAILTVTCDLHSNPPGQTEGVKLAVPGVLNFNSKVSGGNLFIKQ